MFWVKELQDKVDAVKADFTHMAHQSSIDSQQRFLVLIYRSKYQGWEERYAFRYVQSKLNFDESFSNLHQGMRFLYKHILKKWQICTQLMVLTAGIYTLSLIILLQITIIKYGWQPRINPSEP